MGDYRFTWLIIGNFAKICVSVITGCLHDRVGTLASWLIKLESIIRQVKNIYCQISYQRLLNLSLMMQIRSITDSNLTKLLEDILVDNEGTISVQYVELDQ